MLNLLPKEQKKEIAREYRVRIIIVACALFLTGEVISLVLLVPPYLTVQTRIQLLNAQSAGFKAQNVITETSKLSETIQQTNNYLNILTSSTAPTSVVAAIKKIVDIRGSEVKINNFVYDVNNGQQQIVVAGNANSRQALLDFVKRVKSQSGVTSADLPVSDFAKSENIDFSISVLIKT